MKVLQILPTLSFGDGVSNDCIAIKNALRESGYRTEIYAENIDTRLPKGSAYSVDQFPRVDQKDIVIYHLSTGSEWNLKFLELKCRKIVRYHNITPPDYFSGYSDVSYNLCKRGYEEAITVAKNTSHLLADSGYNRDEFVKMGYKGDSCVAPILIPFQDYKKKSSAKVWLRYENKKGNNVVFVGRLAPNKRQERILEIFRYYKEFYDPYARLFLVGSGDGMGVYEEQLKQYASALKVSDVIFTGHVKFDEILAYYQLADTFVCMSDHEGFCIPIVEAMCFDVPVVALDTSAIKETLGGSGFLIQEYKPLEIAGLINRINTDTELREKVLVNQRERLADFSENRTLVKILNYIKRVESDLA